MPNDAHPDLGKYGTNFYFIAQSSQIAPACRVLPINVTDVSETIRIVREAGATFAVKAGGHCPYPSGTNAENGITIDLSRLKDMTVSDDRKSVVVGAGCRFGELYHKLEAHGLGCVGGRISSVGVSGLTMGGARLQNIQFKESIHKQVTKLKIHRWYFFLFQRKRACLRQRHQLRGKFYIHHPSDIKPSLTVPPKLVLANGEVLNVTKKSHPDLFWGMRGAGITFGIVTRLELKTFDLGEIWGGASAFAHEHETAIFDAFNKFVHTNQDPLAEAFLIATDMVKDGNSVYTMVMSHSNPQSGTPSAFDDFKCLTPLFSSAQTRNLKNFCDEMDSQNESGFRYVRPRRLGRRLMYYELTTPLGIGLLLCL